MSPSYEKHKKTNKLRSDYLFRTKRLGSKVRQSHTQSIQLYVAENTSLLHYNTNRLMFLQLIIAYGNHMKYINIVCGHMQVYEWYG